MIDIPQAFPDLRTERLILRSMCEEDIDFVFRQFSSPQVTEYLMDEPPLTSMEGAREIVEFYLNPEGKNHNRWILIRRIDQKPIGTCGFHKWDKAHFRAEIGYDLMPEYWGQGYMTEAVRAAIGNGFTRMGLNRIDALVYTGNPRSYKLLQKLGFRQEGILRDYFCLNGVFYDHYIYGLLRRDWQEKSA